MALIRTSTVIGAISGSSGGTNFVLGKQGAYCRNRVSVSKGHSALQAERRRVISIARQFWQGLSANKKQSWVSFARLIQFTNRLGVKRNLSGWQLFCRYVFENYPTETDFDIDCELLGISEKIEDISTGIYDDSGWQFQIDFVEGYSSIKAKTWASIPFRTTALGFYKHWTLIKEGSMAPFEGGWEYSLFPTGAFSLAVEGDVIGFKMSFRGFLASGALLWSAKTHFHATVIHVGP